MRVLGEIPPPASPPARAGTLLRRDLEAFDALLEQLREVPAVQVSGRAPRVQTAAVGLATAAAAAGRSTVLVECELVEPALAGALGVATAPGLVEYLRGEADPERILQPVALAGPGSAAAREPLICVVAGRPVADAAGELGSARFRHAAERLRRAYELIVFAGPSLTASDGALTAVAGEAAATVLCAGRDEPIAELPVPVDGLIVQDEPRRLET